MPSRHPARPTTATVLPVRRLAALVGLVLLATACTSASGAQTPPPAAVSGGTPTHAPITSGSPATEAPSPRRSDVAVTATGVAVAVVDHTAAGVVVRSPCGLDVEVASVQPLHPVTVVLDPGHGGPDDEGAVGSGGLQERHLNLAVSQAAQGELEARGIATALTRTGDYAVPLAIRAAFADAAKAQVLVSIHHNAPASASSDVPGTEVFVQTGSAESARLGGLLYEQVMDALRRFDIAWTRAHDAGVLQVHLPDGTDAYGMIRRPAMPTALVELGYLANPAEEALFATDAYVAAAADGVADAVEAYLGSDRRGSGHVDAPRVFTPGHARGNDDCVDPPLE